MRRARLGWACVLWMMAATGCFAREYSNRDMFGFANETVWKYEDGKPRPGADEKTGEKYSRRCFVMARATLQFWKFARFEPRAKPVSDGELAKRVRAVCARSVWEETLAADRRVVIPGYPDLRSFSSARIKIVQDNIGLGWPTYFRPGNFCMIFPPGPGSMTETNPRLEESLARQAPQVVWLANFPSLSINHAVLVFAKTGASRGMVRYRVYDPNYTNGPRTLTFDRARGIFVYPKTFYFPGGDARARLVYAGMFE